MRGPTDDFTEIELELLRQLSKWRHMLDLIEELDPLSGWWTTNP